MKAPKRVTNEDILSLLHEFMQLTSDNFLRLENKFDNKFDGLEKRMTRQEKLSEDILERVIYLEHVTVKSV